MLWTGSRGQNVNNFLSKRGRGGELRDVFSLHFFHFYVVFAFSQCLKGIVTRDRYLLHYIEKINAFLNCIDGFKLCAFLQQKIPNSYLLILNPPLGFLDAAI
jgi:hypothetical protein